MKNKKDTFQTWQDLYYNEELDKESNTEWYTGIGWGVADGKGYIEDYSDDYYLKLERGEVERIQ